MTKTERNKKYEATPKGIAKRKARYDKNRDVLLERLVARRKADPAGYLYRTAKARAARKGVEFTIEQSDIVVPDLCPVFKLPFVYSDGASNDMSPSLDRKKNSLGYIPGNVVVISHKANRIKNNATLEEIQRMIRYLEGN